MSKQQPRIPERVKGVISEQFGNPVHTIQAIDNMAEVYFPDDLDYVEIWMSLEDEFNIEIPDGAVQACITVQDIINLIEA